MDKKLYYLISIFVVLLLTFSKVFPSEKAIIIKPIKSEPEKYALLIGINDYIDTNIPDLAYARNDVILLGETLIAHLGFPAERVIPLINESATKRNIEEEMNRLAEYADIDDLVLIFFSGHGTYGDDLDGDEDDGTDEYLLPYDAVHGKLYTAIVDDMFGYWIKRIKSMNVLLLIDSCHSGGAAKGTRGYSMMRTSSKSISRDRVVSDTSRDGIAVITASKADQQAHEYSKLGKGHGVFTYFLCKALVGEADHNRDHYCSIEEIYSKVHEDIKDWTFTSSKSKQTPTIANRIGNGFKPKYKPDSGLRVEYFAAGKIRVMVKAEETKKIMDSEGHYKSVRMLGHWEKDIVGSVWVPGKTKTVWVDPVYKEVKIPAQFKEVEEGRGRFIVVR